MVGWAVTTLAGQFRKGDAADPELFTAGWAVILSDYPEEAIRYVVDPRTGLPGQQSWLPTTFELRQALEKAMRPIREQARHDAIREQNARLLAPPAEDRTAAVERLRRAYPSMFGNGPVKIGAGFGAAPLDPSNVSAAGLTLSPTALAAIRGRE